VVDSPEPAQAPPHPAPEASTQAAGAAASLASAAEMRPAPEALQPPPRPRPGTVVEGTVVRVAADHVLVDIGAKADGVVPAHEVVVPPGKTLADLFAPGDRVQVTVLGYDAKDGSPRLSHRRAAEAAAWRRLEEAFREGHVIEAPVVEAVKGGLALYPGVRAFMPASHVERSHVPDLTPYVGQTLRCRVIELERGKGRVILSRRVVLEEEAQRRREALWAELAEGQVRQGVVKSLTDFGAFVDLGGVDGLLHVSAMAWGRVNHPSEVVSVGDPVTVKVLKVDRERQKVSLGMKQLLPDPWQSAQERYPVGSLVKGRVVRIASFGAFVELEPGIDGLIHVSELADRHVRDPREVVSEGVEVQAKVLRVVPEERRISLSLREAEGRGRMRRREEARPAAAEGGATVGEMVGDLASLWARAQGGEGAGQARGGAPGSG